MIRVQHQREVNELIENVNQKTYAYGDVHAKNQDLLMIISELKDKLKTAVKGKNVNTKFEKYAILGKLLCVTPMNKNEVLKAKMVSKVEVKTDKSKQVTSYSTPKNEQGVASSSSVSRPKSKDNKLKKRVLLNTKSKSTSKDVKKSQKFLWAEAISTACSTQNCSLVHTRCNKTPYKLIKGRKPNVQYFHVFGSLSYSTNDHDDLGKMKLKADIGIFIGYSESLRGFRIYNRGTRKIMETIHVKFDELATMASECNNSGPVLNCLNFQDSSKDSNEIPSKEDLDNLFGPLYEEYYKTKTPEVSNNSAANTLNNENTPSSSSIIIEDNEAPQLVSSLKEPIANEPTTPFSNDNADESV
ncbi:retrovirus-related pol polyprotein from transposon TNT 1-94 [Tanacetum coccineum]